MNEKDLTVDFRQQEPRYTALETNAKAISIISSAVQGSIGPRGLDAMLVDDQGEIVITNDGVTILELMDVKHPAARIMLSVARSQQAEIGDGTTTATLMTAEIINQALEKINQGVPVARIIDGVKRGVSIALDFFKTNSNPIQSISDTRLYNVALVAGRENSDIARLVFEAAGMLGNEMICEDNFKFADIVTAVEGAENEVFSGVLLNKERMNNQMPLYLEKDNLNILIVDDALEPEEVDDEALSTEGGFSRYLQLREDFVENISKIVDIGIDVILVDRGVEPVAEEYLTEKGVLVVQRVPHLELKKTAEHIGAKMIKRTGLRKPSEDLLLSAGRAGTVIVNERQNHIKIMGGKGKPVATILVGAGTPEIVEERGRITRDAAAAIQSAVRGGFLPGGGAIELAASRRLEHIKDEIPGMTVYGLECVIAALQKPFMQIVANAGFNPLEKIGDVIKAHADREKDSLGLDCDTGEIIDMLEMGIVDPTLVKIHALKTAGEVAEAILRINTIIKKKNSL